MSFLRFHRVEVHPCHRGFRKDFPEIVFNFFRAETAGGDLVTAAGGANMHRRVLLAAVMASQLILVFMISERYVAVFAFGYPAAYRADHERRVSSPVLKQDHLLVLCQ